MKAIAIVVAVFWLSVVGLKIYSLAQPNVQIDQIGMLTWTAILAETFVGLILLAVNRTTLSLGLSATLSMGMLAVNAAGLVPASSSCKCLGELKLSFTVKMLCLGLVGMVSIWGITRRGSSPSRP